MSDVNRVLLSVYLKECRVKAGLTQRDISAKLGYTSPQFISNWERGKSQPPLNVVRKLIKLYSINRDELFDILLNQTIIDVTRELRKKFYQ